MKVEVKCQILYLILNSLDIAIPLEIHYRRLKGLFFFHPLKVQVLAQSHFELIKTHLG